MVLLYIVLLEVTDPTESTKWELIVYTIECYSAMRNDDILSFAETWMGLEHIMLNEIRKTEKGKYYMISLIWGI